MNRILSILLFCFLFLLQSCEFSCSVGNKDDAKKLPVNKDGIRTGNKIELESGGIKVDRAYLVFDNGETVPDDNIVDFSRPVKLVLIIEKGWNVENDKVSLGASEKIVVGSGQVLLDERDLFESNYPDGMSASDAKRIALTASISLYKSIDPMTTFIISFRVWDKRGDGFVRGRYKLYSK